MLAVSQLVRDEEFVFRPYGHELQTFGPTLNNAVERERNRLAALVTAVENSAVDERTFIMYAYRVGSFGLLTDSGLQYFVLQTAGGGLHAFAFGILCEEFLAFFFCFGRHIHYEIDACLELVVVEFFLSVLHEVLRYGGA